VNSSSSSIKTRKAPKPSLLPLQRANHQHLVAHTGTFGVGPYTGATRHSWSLSSSRGFRFTFDDVDTERQYDLIRIYELNQDESLGPLVRVLHGRAEHAVVVLPFNRVYVSFIAPANTRGGRGFRCHYTEL
jgi:hypothetical protein